MLPPGMSSNDLTNIQQSGHFGQSRIKQASPLIVQYSKCWPCLRLLYHLGVQQCHTLPYSTLYVAIVTLQRFSGVYIQQDVWWKRVTCSKWTPNAVSLQLSSKSTHYLLPRQDECPRVHRSPARSLWEKMASLTQC